MTQQRTNASPIAPQDRRRLKQEVTVLEEAVRLLVTVVDDETSTVPQFREALIYFMRVHTDLVGSIGLQERAEGEKPER